MPQRRLMTGNEAVVFGALAAQCDAFFGYPITPASEIAERTAEYFPPLGKIFLQAECEVASINMLYGAAAAGLRAMTASSGPGISLMQEGFSYLAGAELPAVIVDVMRVGPGIGNIGAEQSDYFQIVKGGGHGSYRLIVLAPNSADELFSMTAEAFELADRYRNPVVVLADALIAQMMEPVEYDADLSERPPNPKSWQLDTSPQTNNNVHTTIVLDPAGMRRQLLALKEKYERIAATEARGETEQTDDATVILTGYGIVSRILRSVVARLRAEGIAAGLVRPQTLWPFPTELYRRCGAGKKIVVVELSTGQFVEDVRLALPQEEIFFHGELAGFLPTEDELIDVVRRAVGG